MRHALFVFLLAATACTKSTEDSGAMSGDDASAAAAAGVPAHMLGLRVTIAGPYEGAPIPIIAVDPLSSLPPAPGAIVGGGMSGDWFAVPPCTWRLFVGGEWVQDSSSGG